VNGAYVYACIVRLDGGTMQNGLIAGNSIGLPSVTQVASCGVYLRNSAKLLNCLIRDNHYIGIRQSLISGVYVADSATTVNCIIERNGLPNCEPQDIGGGISRFYYCAMPESETNGTMNAIALATACMTTTTTASARWPVRRSLTRGAPPTGPMVLPSI
jgi:hypothetical protein